MYIFIYIYIYIYIYKLFYLIQFSYIIVIFSRYNSHIAIIADKVHFLEYGYKSPSRWPLDLGLTAMLLNKRHT